MIEPNPAHKGQRAYGCLLGCGQPEDDGMNWLVLHIEAAQFFNLVDPIRIGLGMKLDNGICGCRAVRH